MPARSLLYLDVERAGLMSYPALQETIEAYLAWARPSPAAAAAAGDRVFLLLDEVAAIPRWSTALKALHGAGALDGATAIATGSDVLDLTFYQRSRKGGAALDFVAFRDARVACAIEAKWTARVKPREVPFLVRAGGGIVASWGELAWWPEQNVAVIPSAFLAAGFGPGHTLFPAPPA